MGRIEMAVAMILSAVLAAQSAQLAAIPDGTDQADAAYAQLAAGETQDAIAHLEKALERTPGDPALLINLGTAYARAGRMDEARDAFRAAIASEDRYRVELADGSWEDSRRVARLALDSLDRSMLAAK
jgi:Flp pilus assembly protein TadD